jgi:hypothetical protein
LGGSAVPRITHSRIVKLQRLLSIHFLSLALALLPILDRVGADDAGARGPKPRPEVDQQDKPA